MSSNTNGVTSPHSGAAANGPSPGRSGTRPARRPPRSRCRGTSVGAVAGAHRRASPSPPPSPIAMPSLLGLAVRDVGDRLVVGGLDDVDGRPSTLRASSRRQRPQLLEGPGHEDVVGRHRDGRRRPRRPGRHRMSIAYGSERRSMAFRASCMARCTMAYIRDSWSGSKSRRDAPTPAAASAATSFQQHHRVRRRGACWRPRPSPAPSPPSSPPSARRHGERRHSCVSFHGTPPVRSDLAAHHAPAALREAYGRAARSSAERSSTSPPSSTPDRPAGRARTGSKPRATSTRQRRTPAPPTAATARTPPSGSPRREPAASSAAPRQTAATSGSPRRASTTAASSSGVGEPAPGAELVAAGPAARRGRRPPRVVAGDEPRLGRPAQRHRQHGAGRRTGGPHRRPRLASSTRPLAVTRRTRATGASAARRVRQQPLAAGVVAGQRDDSLEVARAASRDRRRPARSSRGSAGTTRSPAGAPIVLVDLHRRERQAPRRGEVVAGDRLLDARQLARRQLDRVAEALGERRRLERGGRRCAAVPRRPSRAASERQGQRGPAPGPGGPPARARRARAPATPALGVARRTSTTSPG